MAKANQQVVDMLHRAWQSPAIFNAWWETYPCKGPSPLQGGVSVCVGGETTIEEPLGFEAMARSSAKRFHFNFQLEIKGTSGPRFRKLTWNI